MVYKYLIGGFTKRQKNMKVISDHHAEDGRKLSWKATNQQDRHQKESSNVIPKDFLKHKHMYVCMLCYVCNVCMYVMYVM